MTRWKHWLVWGLAVCLLGGPSALVQKVSADTSVAWQAAVNASYDTSQPGNILMYPDVLHDGGLNLTTGKFTTDKSSADVAFDPYGSIGANSLYDEGAVSFDSINSVPDSGYVKEASVTAGHVYIIETHDGSFAKLLVKQVLASNITLEYALVDPNGGKGSTGGGGGGTVSQTLTLPEGQVAVQWTAVQGADSYQLLRSDNGGTYTSVSDFNLTGTTFTDQYAFAGHTYLYKVVAVDASGNTLDSSIIQVNVVAAANQTKIVMQINNPVVTVNGQQQTLDQPPTVINYRTLVPVRFLGESIGGQVGWNATTKEVTLTVGSDTLVLTLNSSTAYLNGQQLTMDVPPQIVNGRSMLPVRFVCDTFKLPLDFDSKTGTITITGSGSAPAPTPQPPTPAPKPDLSAFFHTFSMIVPGTAVDGTAKPGSAAGTLTVKSDGTYDWQSDWSGHLTGTWSATGDSEYPIVLHNGEDSADWKLGLSTASLGGDIVIWDGYITQIGTAE